MTKRRLIPTESQEQQALFQWVALAQARYPDLELLLHIPNEGERDEVAAAWYARMGLRPGVPDIHLPVPRGQYHGLWIELKRRTGGRLTPKQRAWLEALSAQGYACYVCRGAEDAIQTIERYLRAEDTPREKPRCL